MLPCWRPAPRVVGKVFNIARGQTTSPRRAGGYPERPSRESNPTVFTGRRSVHGLSNRANVRRAEVDLGFCVGNRSSTQHLRALPRIPASLVVLLPLPVASPAPSFAGCPEKFAAGVRVAGRLLRFVLPVLQVAQRCCSTAKKNLLLIAAAPGDAPWASPTVGRGRLCWFSPTIGGGTLRVVST